MSLDCWSECWSNSLNGLKPILELGHADCSESWEMDQMHVFKLTDGQYVIVSESGCSCYEPEQADVELQPSLVAAFDKYLEYKKKNGISFTNLEFLEMKSLEKENESLDKNLNPKAL